MQVKRDEKDKASTTAESAWVEMCSGVTATLSSAGFHMIVGLCDVTLPEPLPAGICLDARRAPALASQQIVAVYSAADTFKAAKSAEAVIFCGTSFPDWLKERGLTAGDVWEGDDGAAATDLWTAKLFCEAPSPEFLQGYWSAQSFSKDVFVGAKRFSIDQLNKNDSVLVRDELRSKFFTDARGGGSRCAIS